MLSNATNEIFDICHSLVVQHAAKIANKIVWRTGFLFCCCTNAVFRELISVVGGFSIKGE